MLEHTARYFVFLPVLVAAAAAGGLLWAEDPVNTSASQEGVVLLRNGQAIEGKISRAGDLYYVDLPAGQVRLRATDVELVCRDLEEGYRRKRDAVQPDNAADHLRLAQWCQRHGLLGSAAAELAEAKRVDPNHPMIAVVQRRLQMALEPTPPAEPAAAERPVSFDQLDRMVRGMPPGSVETFTQWIQPMLLNNCAAGGCHGLQAESKPRLMRIPGGAPASRRLTQRNLHEVLQWVDQEHPDSSPLLTMPLEPHGTAKAAIFHDRQAMQYKRLVQWVHDVTRHPAPDAPATVHQQRTAPVQAMTQSTDGFGPAPMQPAALGQAAPAPPQPPAVPGDLPAGQPKSPGRIAARPQVRRGSTIPPVTPADPFDPEIFNRGLRVGDRD